MIGIAVSSASTTNAIPTSSSTAHAHSKFLHQLQQQRLFKAGLENDLLQSESHILIKFEIIYLILDSALIHSSAGAAVQNIPSSLNSGSIGLQDQPNSLMKNPELAYNVNFICIIIS